ncbi:L-threonylcarbamoyladenylate synthase [soil metagenome]
MADTLLLTSAEEAAAILRAGGTVAFPTETVYGLGADALNPETVAKVFTAKGRPSDNPLIVHLADAADIKSVAELNELARRLATAFMPGPLTLVLPRKDVVPDIVTAGLHTVAVRIPDEPLAQRLIELAGVPVVAPSANRSGRPSPTTWEAVQTDLDGRIAAILKGASKRIGIASTVVDVTGDVPLVLRAGGLSIEEIGRVAPDVAFYTASAGEAVRSPGLLHRHYSPKARVILVDAAHEAEGSEGAAFIGLDPPAGEFDLVEHCADISHYAHALFDFFRRCDAAGVKTIFAQRIAEAGLGRALMDRLRRAAEHSY